MKKKYFLIGLFFLLAVLILFQFLREINQKRVSFNSACVEIESHRISGNSLAPTLFSGTEVKLLKGYYDCNDFQKGDLIVFKLKTRDDLFIKKLVAFSGDKIEFENSILRVNDEILKNSTEQIYQFNKISKKILEIPLQDNKIPQNRFFVLAEKISSSNFDSRDFGYIEKEHIIGRVLTQEEIK